MSTNVGPVEPDASDLRLSLHRLPPRRASTPDPERFGSAAPTKIFPTGAARESAGSQRGEGGFAAAVRIWKENLPNALPLFFVGAAAFVIAYLLFAQADTYHPTRVPLWLLSLSIGFVATVGAATALLFGDFSSEPGGFEEAALSGGYVLVARSEWDSIRAKETSGGATVPSVTSASLPEWSEADAVEEPSASPTGSVASGGLPPTTGGEFEAPVKIPATFTVGRATRAADRLAEQVDDLLNDLALTPQPIRVNREPSPAAPPVAPSGSSEVGGPLPPRKTAERSPAGRSGQVPQQPSRSSEVSSKSPESPKTGYENLLTELRTRAESEAGPTSPRTEFECTQCRRGIQVAERWKACAKCWQIYCAECAPGLPHPGDEFHCPVCRS